MSQFDAPYLAAWQGVLARSERPNIEALRTTPLPTRRMEDWRFVRLDAFKNTTFTKQSSAKCKDEDQAAINAHTYEGAIGRLVFINGILNDEMSTLPKTKGLSVKTTAVLEDASHVVQKGFGHDHFALVNMHAWQQAVVVHVDKNTSVTGNLHLLFVNSHHEGQSNHARVQVVMSPGSKLSLVEEHLGFGEEAHWTNTLVEVEVLDNARLNHVKLQRENAQSFHTARTAVHLKEGAHYASMTATFGAAFSRHDLWADIQGGNTTCELHGLAVVGDRQVADTHSTMNHDHENSFSDQLHKCIVDDRAHAIFNGKIVVQQDAQQINAFQLNRNLLLSNSAKVDTKPQLEIFADDVKCTHGATIGQLDDDQLFYLQSRGISPEEGRVFLTYAFAAELVERVPVLAVRKEIEQLIAQHIRS